jgi:hypothetical protein
MGRPPDIASRVARNADEIGVLELEVERRETRGRSARSLRRIIRRLSAENDLLRQREATPRSRPETRPPTAV